MGTFKNKNYKNKFDKRQIYEGKLRYFWFFYKPLFVRFFSFCCKINSITSKIKQKN